MVEALDIWVKGIVQGVGFRPFVYKLAKRYLINGWVMNSVDGVHIHAEGEEKLLDEFVMEISENAPAAAQVTEIEMHEVPLEPFDDFEIRFSDDTAAADTTLVSPDLAVCDDCLRELFDPSDRRYRYPFINCTNCGPRFTIIDNLPYDRASTSMKNFTMCDKCQAEYDDPSDRRFHAQPNACFTNGPVISLWEDGALSVGKTRELSDEIFARATEMLIDGKILAVKGLGGFHLVCNANDGEAVRKLRERKHRFGKPLAVMMEDADSVKKMCLVNEEEQAILEGSVRPIVLLRKLRRPCSSESECEREGVSDVAVGNTPAHVECLFAEGLADRLPELGVMLPYTPVQHILMHDFSLAWEQKVKSSDRSSESGDTSRFVENPAMLVMTSGNLHDEPIVVGNDEAVEKLSSIADAIILNDRDIVSRFDDSVVRVISAGKDNAAIQFIRRARGYSPTPILADLKKRVQIEGDGGVDGGNGVAFEESEQKSFKGVFATGAEQKNTFTMLRPRDDDSVAEAFVSQHIGDMENAETFDAWLEAKSRYETLFDFEYDTIACDLHPEYMTTKWALSQQESEKSRVSEIVQVQHHHAHIVSVMAENHLSYAVCGIAFDGTGFGHDGNIWGGEVLLSNLTDFERFINFAYVPMPGGAAAIKHPLRMAYGVLSEFDLLDHPAAKNILESLGEDQAEMLQAMIDQGLNTPFTSSVGRLFDSASAILGICTEPAYEGEAAVLLEARLWDGDDIFDEDISDPSDSYSIEVLKNTADENSTAHDTSVLLFDAASAFKSLLDDMQAGVPAPVISKRFHNAFVNAVLQAAQLADALYGIKTVALTGGVFMNRYLIEHSIDMLQRSGFTVAINNELPPNDGCISFGQSVVAARM